MGFIIQSNSGPFLSHFGILGQKWGVRRFQNEDGTLTEEGKRRYLQNPEKGVEIYNQIVDRMNSDLRRINKKYKNADLVNDDKANLEYTREIVDTYKQHYRNILAKDIGTDPDSLRGQKWLDQMFGYKTNMDKELSDLEKKVKAQEKEEESPPKKTKEAKTGQLPKLSVPASKAKKMSQTEIFNTVYGALEEAFPNFYKMPQSKQDKLFIDLINESGLYKYI